MLETWLTERFALDVPLVGAPMAGVAGGRLAGAISAAGALGMVGIGGGGGTGAIQAATAEAAAAGRPFGAGLMAWVLESAPEQLDAVLASRPALVSVSFGSLQPWVGRLRAAGVAVVTQVADADEALRARDAGVDIVVARGAEGGGHGRDRVATLPLLDAVLEAVDLPVLAAGGVSSARAFAAVLAAGAAGAWVGTAFLACDEAANSPAAREQAVAARETDTVYTRVFDVAQGIPWPQEYGGRALRNDFTDRWADDLEGLAADESARAALAEARRADDYRTAYVYAGQGVAAVRRREPAADVVRRLADGAEELLRRW